MLKEANTPVILVVEDSKIQSEFLGRTLEQAGYRVRRAVDGVDGLEQVRAHTPDLVLTDINMPRMNGLEFCKQIRSEPEIAHTRVIMVTTLTDLETVFSATNVGADEYVVKPFVDSYLLKKVGDTLSIPTQPAESQQRVSGSITVAGHRYEVDAPVSQFLRLFVSTYENATQQNRELMESHFKLKESNLELQQKLDELELSRQELSHSEERFKSLVSVLPDVIFRLDEEGIIIFINHAIEHYGWQPEQLLGQHFSILLSDEDAERVSRNVVLPTLKGLITGEHHAPKLFDERRGGERGTHGLEINILGGGGELRSAEVRLFSEINSAGFHERDDQYGSVGMIHDISERKAAEERIRSLNASLENRVEERTRELLISNQHLEKTIDELDQYKNGLEEQVAERTSELLNMTHQAQSATEAKSTFLASMSHEIRTPLNAILSFTYLLLQETESESQKARLLKIQSAGSHLLSLINDILDLSKIEAGKMELELLPVAVGQIPQEVVSLFQQQAHERSVTLSVEVDQLPAALMTDKTRLSQALINLVGNAVKFTEQGNVTIRLQLVSRKEQAVVLRFEVEDSGIGIPAEQLGQLFHPFQQADSSTTRKYGGSGLGLALTKLIVERMGGEIGVESKEGEGSRFWFTLTLKQGEVQPDISDGNEINPDAPELLRQHGARFKLLLVEDDPVNQEVALSLLQTVGLQADTADNGQQALDRVRDNHYNLILMDQQMPVLDGLEATRQIRKLSGKQPLPILAMTANAFHEDRERCLAAGMDDFVSKPVDPPVLFTVLQRWLLPDESMAAADKVTNSTIAASEIEPKAEVGSDSPLLESLESVDGIDLERGLRAFNGSVERYGHMLERFVQLYADAAAEMGALMASQQRPEAQRLAHTVKGSAATLGLIKIQQAALELEGVLKQEEGQVAVEAAIATLEALLRTLKEQLPSLRGSVELGAGEGSCEIEPVLQSLQQMKELLMVDDAEVISLVEAERNTMQRCLGAEWEILERHLDNFDFKSALNRVELLLHDYSKSEK